MANALHLNLNPAQTRIKSGRIAAFAQGAYKAEGGGYVTGWSERFLSQAVYDVATYTLFLEPFCFTPTWYSSNSGDYAKLGLGDFTLDDSANWKTSADSSGLVYMYHAGNASGLTGVSTATFGKNRGFYLSYFVYSTGNAGKQPVLECGWNSTATGAVGPSWRFYDDGSVEAWKDNLLRGTYSIAGDQNTAGATQTEKSVAVMLLPARNKEWIVVSSTGGSFNHVDDTIDETDPARIIAPDTNFWFKVPAPCQPMVLFAPLKFPTSGFRCTKTLGLCDDPTTHGAAAYTPYFDLAYPGASTGGTISLVSAADGSTAYSYGSDALLCRLRFDLTGDGAYTPFVYGGVADFAPTTANTNGSSVEDIVGFVTDCVLDVPDSPAGVALHLEGRNPADMATASFLTLGNQPFQMKLGTIMVIDGRTDVPQDEIVAVEEARKFSLEIRDQWKLLEKTRFRDPLPLDQLTLKNALKAVLKAAKLDGAIDIYDDSYTIDRGVSPSQGDWACLVDVNEEGTCAKWIERLMETFAGNWYFGFKPYSTGIKFYAKPPDMLGSSKVTLYGTIADAVAAGFTDYPHRHVYRKFHTKPLEPECNVLRVTGYDPRAKRPFQVVKRDDASRDPTTAPASRPTNWVGEDYEVGYFEPLIQTDAAGTRMVNKLFPRLSVRREPGEWEAEMQFDVDGVPIWRGDVITLDGIGDFVVNSASSHLIQTVDADGFLDRETTYTGELQAS